ncbi:MAG: hypothetical protein ACU0CY_10900 [Maritimibacter harenae]
MAEAKILRIYLDDVMLDMARRGVFGFVARVTKAFEEAGFRVELRRNGFEERLKSGARHGYSLFLMDDPFHPKSLTMRKAYYFPFWRIEATARRWEFEVARKTFDPADIDPVTAENWVHNWRRWIFKRGPEAAEKTGLIYVALQGKLAEHRSFQSMSPMEMIAAVRDRAGDRRILLGLHPGEDYPDRDRAALDRIAAEDSRVTIRTGGMEEALRVCDAVVTQNSAAALSGFFFGKPAILFGDCDFHHQMPRVGALGVDEAWRHLEGPPPAFDQYLYWFIQLNAIKADEEGIAEERIRATCRRHGWEI